MILRIPFEYPQVTVVRVAAPKWLPEAPRASASVASAPATQVAVAERELETLKAASFVDVPIAKVAFAEPLPEAPKAATSFVDALIESAEKLESGSLQQQSIPVPPPVKKQPQPLGPNVLSRGWSWLKQNQHFKATKQLRVLETVSLGEKRFIALVHVEGQRFLIGGGASNVCLLTQLGNATNAVDALQPVAQAGSISE